MPEALLARVGLDELDPLGGAAGELEVAQRLGVDREDRARRAELRRHVADRRPVGEREVRHARAEELDELADHAVPAQHLRDGEHEVGGGRALLQLALELEADHARDEHRHRLAEHRGLGLDAADAPAQHAQPVDHRRVRVGPDERVGIGLHRVALAVARGLVAREDDPREVLEVDLVHDAGVRRHHAQALEGALAPAQERVALLVALELLLGVDAEGVARAEDVDLHGVVDHELGGDERVDPRRVAAHVGHRVAHHGEVDDGGHAREVLHHDPRGRERDLVGGLGLRVPGGERLDVVLGDGDAVLVAQQVLEQHLQGEGQARDVVARLQRLEAVDLIRAPADLEVAAGIKGVLGHGNPQSSQGVPAYTRGGERVGLPRPPALVPCARRVLEPVAQRTFCEYKGRAAYFDVAGPFKGAPGTRGW